MKFTGKKGFVLAIVLALTILLVIIAAGFIALTNNELRIAKHFTDSMKAFYLAEAGIEKAIYELSKNDLYLGETNIGLGDGVYDVNIKALIDEKEIVSTGYIPDKISPTAIRKIRVVVKRPAAGCVSLDAAVVGLTNGNNIDVRGTALIDGKEGIGIKIPDLNMVTTGGDADILGQPPTLEQSPLPAFEDIFGMTKEEMKMLATVYDNPKPNKPNPASGITWIEGDASFTSANWSGDGIIIVTGNLTITGGLFEGVIYVMGDADIAKGNALVKGGMLIEGNASFAGTNNVIRDVQVIEDIKKYYPYEVSTWEEI